ncbi:protein NRT1/ PTR FAMILY 2.7-like [Tasmannia lanceolata]|uniref:protein NRT1/ PTR FAMILY 2.7-like n=1 Tax=Tasmannia lanceolata TaxID=3420 RepID=UPI004063EB25
MGTEESQKSQPNIDNDPEIEIRRDDKRGGWITFPFIAGNMMGLGMASSGLSANLIVYLIKEFNVKSIKATNISNVVNGCLSLAPIFGAIITDSFFGCFSIVSISTFIALLGMNLLTLTATVHSLRPPSCTLFSSTCETPSTTQFSVLYASIALTAIGVGGTRFNTATMGAYQFDKAKDRDSFFNWYFFALYISFIVGSTFVVYIEDNVGWGWGFGLCAVANGFSLAIFLLGTRFYCHLKPKGSPFTGLARVLTAAIRKRKVAVASESREYYYGGGGVAKFQSPATPTSSFSFFNRAALKTEGDTHLDGSLAKPWRLCTVEQVEDLKTLIKIFPVWSSAIFLHTPIAIQGNLTVLQALSMDRHLGRSHFLIPAGSFLVFVLLASAISLSIIDRFLIPKWRDLTGQHLTPLQRIGLGHVLSIAGMVGSAIVESRRIHTVRSHHLDDDPYSLVPMSALWLVPPLVLVGVGEAFHFPGQVGLYYQEFPASFRSTSTAMIALLIGIAYYLSTGITNFVRRITGWLPDNINQSRLDNVYWMLAVIGVLNFGYYLLCTMMYKYQNARKVDVAPSSENQSG